MLRDKITIFRRLVFIADLSLVALALQLSAMLNRLRLGLDVNVLAADDLLLPAIIIWGVVYWFVPECYTIRLKNIIQVLLMSVKTGIAASGIFLAYTFAMGNPGESRFQIFLFLSLTVGGIAILRLAIVSFLEFYRSRGYDCRNVLIVGTGTTARGFADKVLNNSRFGLRILGFVDWRAQSSLWRYSDIPCVGNLETLPAYLKNNQIDWVVFAVGRRFLEKIKRSIEICEQMGVHVAVLADFFPLKIARKRIDSFFDSPMICYDTGPRKDISLIMKGLLDRCLAAIGLLLSSPILIAAALAVKFSSRGPALFMQERCGLNGRKFTLYKLRTMVLDADTRKGELMRFNEMDGAAFKMTDDPRVTRLGRFFRRTSIDELPQLINILKGDMSFVGPRPPLADEVAEYDLWQRRRLSVKPGLTCLWQISGRSNVKFEQWIKLDLRYIDNWSLWEDAKILAKTVPAVLKGSGAR